MNLWLKVVEDETVGKLTAEALRSGVRRVLPDRGGDRRSCHHEQMRLLEANRGRCLLTEMDDPRVQLVQSYWAEAWSAGHVEILGQFYAANFRENDDELTPDQFAAHLLRWREKFPDFRADVVRVWSTPEAVVTRVIYTGTHRGDFSFLPATGRPVRSSGLDVFEFDPQGKVVQHWHSTDHWELFEQLGATVVARERRHATQAAEAVE